VLEEKPTATLLALYCVLARTLANTMHMHKRDELPTIGSRGPVEGGLQVGAATML